MSLNSMTIRGEGENHEKEEFSFLCDKKELTYDALIMKETVWD